MKKTKSAILSLFLLSLVLIGATFLSGKILPAGYLSQAYPYIIALFFASTSIFFLIVYRTFNDRFRKFSNTFMLASIIKMLFYLVVVLMYTITNNEDALPFTVYFMILYIIYTIFEVFALVKRSRN